MRPASRQLAPDADHRVADLSGPFRLSPVPAALQRQARAGSPAASMVTVSYPRQAVVV